MEDTLDIDLADKAQINFAMTGSSRRVDVRQSATILLGYGGMGKLKAGTVLSGKLFFTADSVYGLFTEARTEDGTTYPVCLELYDVGDSTVPNRIGAPREDVGGPADSAVIFSSLNVRAVRQFPGKP
jgi:serine/threonine-protein kinase